MKVVQSAILLCCVLSPVAAAQPAEKPSPAAERLIIAFERGSYRVVSRVAVEKTLPASDALPEGPGPFSGFWFEVRDADGSTRYRRVMGDPVLLVAETPPDGAVGAAAGGLTTERRAAVPDSRTFAILIPAARDGDEVLFFGPPYAPDERGAMAAPRAAASIEVARLVLEPRP
jgi:hypothetical protein